MAVVINGTTGISGVDGSAGTPALQGTDTNTGITYPASNVIGFSADGVERLRVTTSGLQYNGSSSGGTIVQANATASGTLTLPASTGTLAITTSPVFTTPAIIGSSTGYTTLASANTSATNYTLTFPAKTGNIITSADSGTVTGTMLASATVAQSNLATNVAGNGPSFSASAGTQTLTTGVTTLIQISSVDWSSTTGNCFNNTGSSTTLNGLTVPAYSFCPNVAGYYYVNASVAPASSATAILILLYRNGSSFKQFANSNTASVSQLSGSLLVNLNGTGDYIQLYAQFVSTGQAVSGGGTFFQAAMIRSA
jgi:hypothetical protein